MTRRPRLSACGVSSPSRRSCSRNGLVQASSSPWSSGPGIMEELLASGNVAIALLANTLATVWGLYILIEVSGPTSGAHFNPVVSAVMAVQAFSPSAS